MSILRLKSLALYQKRDNVTWEFAEVYLWSSIEIGVGIICACLPTLRLLLVKIWPVLAGSTVRDSKQWYNQSGKGSQASRSTAQSLGGKPLPPTPTFPTRAHSRANGSISRRVTINGRDVGVRPGRRADTSSDEYFVMQHHDRSEISLILMKTEQEPQRQHV